MNLRAIFLLIIIIWVTCLTAQFSGGSGTESDPYQVASIRDLVNVRNYPQAHFLQTDDIHLSRNWQPIPLFSGTYDGNGYTIYNLKINNGENDNVGLFAVLLEGSLSRIRLEGGTLTGRDNVGALAGSNEGGIIFQCSATVSVTGNNDVGGLVGSNFGVIQQSFSHSSTITGKENIGGLAGANYAGEIIDSYSTKNISGVKSTGGLAGLNIVEGMIRNCYATGKVTGNDHTGGLIGNNIYADIQNSFWDIEASGQETSAEVTGVVHPGYITHNYHGLTTVKMMQQDTYPQGGHGEWDFDGPEDIWAISEWYNENPFPSYPFLQWQSDVDPPLPSEHNKPINYDDFYTEDGREFDVQNLNNPWRWVSFPWISRDADELDFVYPRQTAEEALRPLANMNLLQPIIDEVEYLYIDEEDWPEETFEKMEWDGQIPNEPWNPDDIRTLCSTKGYKLRFAAAGTHYLPLYGTRVDPETAVILYPGQITDDPEPFTTVVENWIGYFIETSQSVWDAFSNIQHLILFVQTENGGRYRHNGDWIKSPSRQTLNYGDMAIVALDWYEEEIIPFAFQWNIPRDRTETERELPIPKPEHFTISYGPDYESIFIMDIADDEDVVEVAVYAGQECIGASVFQGEYPLEILAYTNSGHRNENLSFVLYLRDESYVQYDEVLVEEPDTRGYSREEVTPLKNRFTLVKLDRTGGQNRSVFAEDVTEETVHHNHSLNLRQNYPNPFSLRTGIRGQGLTNISLSLPQNMPVDLNVYNIKGQLVKTLITGEVNRGEHTVRWNGKDNNNNTVSSGIYFYRLETAEKTITRKMLIVR